MVSNNLDMMAFFPNPLFSVSADLMIATLRTMPDQTKGLNYLVKGNGIGGFHATEDGEWRALWSSSFKHLTPGCTTYCNNDVEAVWASANIVESECFKKNFAEIFRLAQKRFHALAHDASLRRVEHIYPE